MALPVETAEQGRWGGPVSVRRRILDSSAAIGAVQPIVRGDPNRVAWAIFYTTPGLGAIALPIGLSLEDPGDAIAESDRPTWVLRANGDYLELDVREDADFAIRPVWGWWQPTYSGATSGTQHVEVWEYVRIHSTPEDGRLGEGR